MYLSPSLWEFKFPHISLSNLAYWSNLSRPSLCSYLMTEELTPSQLQRKTEEVKKMHKARAKGKWAVYRCGRTIIQEFRSPKPKPLELLDTETTPILPP